MEKMGAYKERRAKEIISEIVDSSKSEHEANKRLLASNGCTTESNVIRHNNYIEDERVTKCQFLEDYYRLQSTYCYINCKFDLKPTLMNNLSFGFPDRLSRKNEQLMYMSRFTEDYVPEALLEEMALENTIHKLTKREYLQSRLVTTFDRTASSGYSTTFNNIFLSTKTRSLNINSVTIENDGNMEVDNQVYHYEEYIASEGLELDYSLHGGAYRLFNRRQNGVDVIEFNSTINMNRKVKIRDRIDLDGRTQYFHKQRYPSNMLDCLSAREDGACLYLIDLEKPHKPTEHLFGDKVIKSYDTYDDYGKLFCMSDHDTLFFYDSRTKETNELTKLTNSVESKFNLIYNTFRDGRIINLVTMANVLVYDIRNPGSCVLKFKHFCDVPPNRHTFAKSIDEECQRDMIDGLLMKDDFGDFEGQINKLLDDNVEMRDKSLKNSMSLYSCRKGSFPVYLTNYEPYDKQDVDNKFNYDIIKEINHTLDYNRLFSQLTKSEVDSR